MSSLIETPRGRRALFAFLYACEGAPIGFVWWAMPTLLRSAGTPTSEVAALVAVLALPWAFKFLWAPIIDSSRASRRTWILACQGIMAASLAAVGWLDPIADFGAIRLALLVHAFAAATQDAAIDALAIATVPETERGRVNGSMQAGMLVARFAFGSGVLALGTTLGLAPLVFVVGGTILAAAFAVAIVVPRDPPGRTPTTEPVLATLREALRARSTRLGLAFALLGGLAFEAVGAVAGPFLLDLGFDERRVALFYALAAGVTIAGALVGGRLSDGNRHRAAAGGVLGVAAAVAAVALSTSTPVAAFGFLVVLYLGIGFLTAASYALFMDLTDPSIGATQFSAFMGTTNLCESLAAFGVGRLLAFGPSIAFLAMAALSLLSLEPLRRLASERRGGSS